MPSSSSCPFCGAANQPQASFCHACGSSLQPSARPSVFNTGTGQLLPNSLLKQRYRILHPMGQGGMGTVYEAEDTQLGNRKVALKEMRQSGLSPPEITDAANAFRQEALMLAALRHQNLPRIYDHFQEAGNWYLVMDFIEGQTLEDYRKAQGGKLPVGELLDIGIQLCTVLYYLHTRQPQPIIFRDLKPSNIMRTPDGYIYLIDFGIARHFKPGQTHDTVLGLSLGYAAPEQFGRAQTSPQSDIYSLGATLYHLLTGIHPILNQPSFFDFPPLRLPSQPTPLALERLIAQMVSKDMSKRPASMTVVKQELQRITDQGRTGQLSPGTLLCTYRGHSYGFAF